jgi:hypothetical protein
LDDFRIYNYRLTSTQIGDLFAIGDMVQHLPLDETSGTTAHDNAGSNNGTLVNGPTWTTGTWGGALNFDGTNDYVSCWRTIGSDMTIALWAKTTSSAVGPWGNPYQWWDGEGLVDADKYGHANDFGCSDNRGKFCYGNGHTGEGDISVRSTSQINDGNWHHLAATRDSTTRLMTVYVDGIAENSAFGHSGTKDATTGMRIGVIQCEGDTPRESQYFQGQIDDVRIYRRVLTADQILLLLEQG